MKKNFQFTNLKKMYYQNIRQIQITRRLNEIGLKKKLPIYKFKKNLKKLPIYKFKKKLLSIMKILGEYR